MLPEFHKVFTVKHSVFYEELKEWRLEYLDHQSISDCVYFLISNNPVPRVLKNDDEGILYIGKGTLQKNHERIGELINTIKKSAIQHEAGERYWLIQKEYQIDGLKLGVLLTADARKTEEDHLDRYLNIFGELPPLNRQG